MDPGGSRSSGLNDGNNSNNHVCYIPMAVLCPCARQERCAR